MKHESYCGVISNNEPVKLKIYLLAVTADSPPDKLLENAVYIHDIGKET